MHTGTAGVQLQRNGGGDNMKSGIVSGFRQVSRLWMIVVPFVLMVLIMISLVIMNKFSGDDDGGVLI